jgi:ABC-2 type transport system permease protein
MAIWGNSASLIEQFGISYHYNAMSKGLLDSRNLIYFFSVAVSMLLLTKLIIGSRKW